MLKQKFRRGNLVRIADDLGESMSHFTNGCNAIIIGTYSQLHGGFDIDSYQIMFPETGDTCAWYNEWQLTLIDDGGEYLIERALENKLKHNAYIILTQTNFESLSDYEINTLFTLINHKIDFNNLGTIFKDWKIFYPKFMHIKKSKSINEAKSMFTSEELTIFDIESVFEVYHMNDIPSKNIDYILSKLDEPDLTTESVLCLFNLIGYRCRGYLDHGEFYAISADWTELYPVFIQIKRATTFEEATNLEFLPIYLKFNISPSDVERVFNAFHKGG